MTSADLEVQRIVQSVLGEELPAVPVFGEESEDAGGWGGHDPAAPVLVVDPIDGTTNFLRGVPFFSVTCAYLEGAEARVGAVYDPVHDDLFAARRGGGAFLNDRAAAPEPVREIGRAEVCLPLDTLPDEWRGRVEERLLPRVYKVRAPRSVALEICGVGCGRFSAGLHGRVAVWDAAAAALFLEEAGGVWSTLDGTAAPWRARITTVAAATPELHAAIVRCLAG